MPNEGSSSLASVELSAACVGTLDAMVDAIAVVDVSGVIRHLNLAFRRFSEKFADRGGAAFRHGADCLDAYEAVFVLEDELRGAMRQGFTEVERGTRQRFDMTLVREGDTGKLGEREWCEIVVTQTTIDGARYLLVQQRDVSEQKRAEAKLRASEESLAKAQRIGRMGNWDWNIQTGALWWSDEIYRIFGLEPRVFGATYEAFLKTVHPEDRDRVTAAVNQAVEGRTPYGIEHRIVLPGGEVRVVRELGEVSYAEEGTPFRMIGIVQDITEQKRTEDLLRAQSEIVRQLATPLLPVSESVLVLPLVGEVDRERSEFVMEALLHGISKSRARFAILDITGVPTMDSYVADALLRAARGVCLLGAEVVLTGIRSEVAQTLVGLGVDLSGIVTCQTLQSGIAYAMGRTGKRS